VSAFSGQRWFFSMYHRHSSIAFPREKRKTSLKYSTTLPFTFSSLERTHHFCFSQLKAHSAGHYSESFGDSPFSAPFSKFFSSNDFSTYQPSCTSLSVGSSF